MIPQSMQSEHYEPVAAAREIEKRKPVLRISNRCRNEFEYPCTLGFVGHVRHLNHCPSVELKHTQM